MRAALVSRLADRPSQVSKLTRSLRQPSFGCWYFTVGFPGKASRAGPVFLEILLYEFIYTGIGQFIASESRIRIVSMKCAKQVLGYAPTATYAALVNPLIIGTLLSFAGVFVPYSGE
jgi:hypothetical protein